MDELTEPILQFFAYTHLPPHLQAVSKPFCDLAHAIVGGEERAKWIYDGWVNDPGWVPWTPGGNSLMQDKARDEARKAALPRNPERTVALRKLLEAKDAAVRALIFK